MVHASFPIWAHSLGQNTLFFTFRDLGQTDFSTSEFAAAIAEEGIILAKYPLFQKGSLSLEIVPE